MWVAKMGVETGRYHLGSVLGLPLPDMPFPLPIQRALQLVNNSKRKPGADSSMCLPALVT
jgi:hypothetical protein